MKKLYKNWKLQGLGLAVMIASVYVSISTGVKYSPLHMGHVLGVSNPGDSTNTVSSLIYGSDLMQIRSGYELVILVAFLLLAIYIVRQFIVILQKLGSDKNFGLGNILKILAMDIVIFVVTVASLAGLNIWTIQREAPRDLSYERITSETVRIVWESKMPVMSQVLWGYSPEHLDNVSLGTSGEGRVQSHEVILAVVPGQDLYFKVIVNGIKYGEAGKPGYYHLGKNSKVDQIYELRLKEAEGTSSKSK